MKILVTGGAGYIGSHTCVLLLEAGHEITIVDDYSNSSPVVIERIQSLTGKHVTAHKVDLQDTISLSHVFEQTQFDAVMHFAGLKAVGESNANPLRYYRVNIDSTLSLLEMMRQYSVSKLIFSSSATVYGSAPIPYREDGPIGQGIMNPYGQTKYIIEQILRDCTNTDPTLKIGSLRYFNPVGAHPSAQLGEQPSGTPNNLMPYLTQVAAGQREYLSIFGNDYATPDGTGVRDYVHVMDVAHGHVAMLQHLTNGFQAINLGAGTGISVQQIIQTFERVNDLNIPVRVTKRRDGDLAAYYADISLAKGILSWQPTRSLEDICRDSWRWQQANT